MQIIYWIIIFSSLVSCADLRAEILTKFVQFGSCGFLDPEIPFPSGLLRPRACLEPTILSEILTTNSEHLNYINLNHGSLYGGFFLNRNIALHGEVEAWNWTKQSKGEDGVNKTSEFTDRQLEQFYLHLGNPASSWVQLSFGFIEKPLGINHKVAPQIVNESIKSSPFFSERKNGTIISFDNLRELTWELGFFNSTDLNDPWNSKHRFWKESVWNSGSKAFDDFSTRLMIDSAILNGMRWVLSFGSTVKSSKTIGVGLVVLSSTGDGGAFEWAQSYDNRFLQSAGNNQFFRLSYKSERKLNSRFQFDFEQQRQKYRLFGIYPEFRLFDGFTANFGGGYKTKLHAEEHSFWFGLAGIEGKL